jgi:hypothetical protein
LLSEVKDSILPDLVRYTVEMEQGLRQMMESLLSRQEEAAAQMAANQEEIKARQEEMKADINAQAATRQDKADAEARTRQEQ